MKTCKPNPRRAELRALSAELRPAVKAGLFPTMNAAILAHYAAETGATEWRTFAEWRRMGRPVKKGESGFPVWALPRRLAVGTVSGDAATLQAITGAEPQGPEFFPVCYLFHVGQVEAPAALAVAA